MAKVYKSSSIYADFEITGIIGLEDLDNPKKNTFHADCNFSNDIDDGYILDKSVYEISMKENFTSYSDVELTKIIEIAIDSSNIHDVLNDADNWEAEVDADEDVNGYVESYNLTQYIDGELDCDTMDEAINIYKI